MSQVKVKVVAPFNGEEPTEENLIIHVPKGQEKLSVDRLMAKIRWQFKDYNFRCIRAGIKQFNIIAERKEELVH